MQKNKVIFPVVLFVCILLLSACKASNVGVLADGALEDDVVKGVTSELNEISAEPILSVSNGQEEVTTLSEEWDDISESEFEYSFDDRYKGVRVWYNGYAKRLRFPDTINGDPVVSIHCSLNPDAFKNIEAVYIPATVKEIGAAAFKHCANLTSIILPDGLEVINDDAFRGCTGLKSIVIPDSVTTIGRSAFENCAGLASIEIPNSVITIADRAFSACANITSITVPDSVKDIGYMAFAYCKKLADIKVPADLELSSDMLDDTYWYFHQPDGLVCFGDILLGYKGAVPDVIEIPDAVTRISKGAFFNCKNLRSVILPDSVTQIGDFAFSGCSSLDEDTKRRIHQINPDIIFDR